MGGDEVDRSRWDASHTITSSPTYRRVRRQTISGALPDGVEPTTLWPAWPLDRLASALELRPGEVLVDVGGGNGAIGLWIAGTGGTSYVGVEPSPVARAQASQAAGELGVDARLVDGTFAATGLADASADGVLLVDALQLAPDRPAAVRELARVLRPGRRLVIVGPERSDPRDELEASGFEIEERVETPGWRSQMQSFAAALADADDALQVELGDEAVEVFRTLPFDQMLQCWHGLVVARRPETSGT